MNEIELDPRWEWIEVNTISRTRLIRGLCNHLEVVPVESGGEVVAQLCLTCDRQFPPPNVYTNGHTSDPEPPTRTSS